MSKSTGPTAGLFIGLVRRFSPDEAELAAKLSNDIAEGIDCGECRTDLRKAIAYWADVAAVEGQRRAAMESQLAIFRSAKALMDTVLSPNATSSATKGGR